MIAINDKYAVKSDASQWILCRAVRASDSYPDGWKPSKYFMSLRGLTEALRNIMLRESEYKSFADLEVNLRGINKLLEKTFRGAFK